MNMLRADGSSPSQMFSGQTKKQKLPMLNPNATSFDPDPPIQKRDKLHTQRCNLLDQHSVIIADLVPGEEVLVQDYLTGLWSNLATVLSIKEDKRSHWVRDKHSRNFIKGRRRLKQISQPSTSDETGDSTQTNQVSIMQSTHSSLACSLKIKTCIFYLNDEFYPLNQPSTSKYSLTSGIGTLQLDSSQLYNTTYFPLNITICLGLRLFAGHPNNYIRTRLSIVEPSDHDDAARVPPLLPSPDFMRQLIENWILQICHPKYNEQQKKIPKNKNLISHRTLPFAYSEKTFKLLALFFKELFSP